MIPWSTEWPRQAGWYWYYGTLSSVADEPRLYVMRVRGPLANGDLAYICNNTFIYPHEGGKGHWQELPEPELPGSDEPHPLILNDDDHCDYHITDPKAPHALRAFLFVQRLPAMDKMLYRQMHGELPQLWAKHRGEWVKVVMASRFGDVGITKVLDADHGYEQRVPVKELSNFVDHRPDIHGS